MNENHMSKLTFVIYYSGLAGLLLAYTIKEVWLDRASLLLLLLGCWLHARLWKRRIESISTPVYSLVEALDLVD